jgi:hypothetical protein
MLLAVLVTRHADNQFTASALAFSDMTVTGTSEAEVIARLRAALLDLQARSRIVHVDLLIPEVAPADPWLTAAGMWESDPSWDAFRKEMSAYRQSVDCEPDQA